MFHLLVFLAFLFKSCESGLLGDVGEPVEFFNLDVNYENPDQIFKEFEEFVTKFKKEYKTMAEKEYRFKQFTRNHNEISKLNKLSKTSGGGAVYGVNKFADRSEKEYINSLSKVAPKLHPEVPELNIFGKRKATNSTRRKRSLGNVPKSFDLRTKKIVGKYVVGDVKNQGECGCCWAFAVTAVMESVFAINQKKFTSLSDQEICDCGSSPTPGCVGGDYVDGMKHVYSEGQSANDEYPYVDGRSNFTGRCDANKFERKIPANGIRFFQMSKFNTELDIMQNLFYVNTPVAVAFRIGHGFQFYKSDVLEQEDCKLMEKVVWHSAAIVGYGTTINERGRKVDYWILKNSWDSDWGEDGYIRVVRGVNWCQIESHAMSADMRPVEYYNQFADD